MQPGTGERRAASAHCGRTLFDMRKNGITPIGAMWRGAVAGVAGSAAMNAWFAVAGKHMPPPREGAFLPPEKIQETELPTETIARRVVSGMAQRGTLSPSTKRKAGRLVHYGFGADWGTFYGIIAESLPAARTPAGALAFGALVWSASDHLLLPAFRLGPWPMGVSAKGHAFWLASHLAYGAALGASYAALRPRSFASVAMSFVAQRIGAVRRPTRMERFKRTLTNRVYAAPA